MPMSAQLICALNVSAVVPVKIVLPLITSSEPCGILARFCADTLAVGVGFTILAMAGAPAGTRAPLASYTSGVMLIVGIDVYLILSCLFSNGAS